MVRYHNSGTQKFDDTEHDSVNTDSATIRQNYGRIIKISDFDIANQNTFTQIPFDSAEPDLASAWDETDGSFVAPADGQYLFKFSVALSPSEQVDGRIIHSIEGGAADIEYRRDSRNVSIDDVETYEATAGGQLDEGDEVVFSVLQSLENNLTVDSSSNRTTAEYWRIG